MSRWSVWQIGRGGAVERVGTYTSGADARRVLRSSILRGVAVDPDGEVNEARGISPAHVTAIEAAADEWLATAAPTMPAPAAVIEIPEPLGIIREDEGEPDALAVGIGATTEPPRCRTTHHDDCDCQRDARGEPRVEAPLPVPFEPPVVEPAPRSFAGRAADLRAEITRGIPSADIEHLRIARADATARAVAAEQSIAQMQAVLDGALADATARAVAAEQSIAQMQAVLDGARATAAALDTRAERAESERDALASSLRERSEQLDAARRDITTRDRTIATLRAELAAKAHPVVRVAPKPRRVRKAAGETPLGTIMRRLSERSRGVR